MKLFKIAGIAIAVAVVASVAMNLGDLRRYIKLVMM
jgi:hypothetical protein